jgi:hypothetical protein
MKNDDLPPPFGRMLVATGHSLQHKARACWSVAFANDILIGFEISLAKRQIG